MTSKVNDRNKALEELSRAEYHHAETEVGIMEDGYYLGGITAKTMETIRTALAHRLPEDPTAEILQAIWSAMPETMRKVGSEPGSGGINISHNIYRTILAAAPKSSDSPKCHICNDPETVIGHKSVFEGLSQNSAPNGYVLVLENCQAADYGTGAFDGYRGNIQDAYYNVQNYINWSKNNGPKSGDGNVS